MAEKKPSLWKRVVGYCAFGLFALVATFFLTFPYETLKETIKTLALSNGYAVKIGSLGPGFFAVRATGVEVVKKFDMDFVAGAFGNVTGLPIPTGGDLIVHPQEPLMIDSVSVGPSIFPPGLAVRIKLMGGTIITQVTGMSAKRIRIDAEDLDLSKGNLKAYSGIDFSGVVGAHVDLSVPNPPGGTAPAEPDLTQSHGTISVETKSLAINGGSANITIAQFGPEPTPVDLPKILLGELNGKMKIEKGAATIEEFKSKSADLETNITGTLKLAKRLEYSEPALEVRVKPDPEFQKRLGLLGSALSMIGSDPKDPTWRMGRLSGYLGRPMFR